MKKINKLSMFFAVLVTIVLFSTIVAASGSLEPKNKLNHDTNPNDDRQLSPTEDDVVTFGQFNQLTEEKDKVLNDIGERLDNLDQSLGDINEVTGTNKKAIDKLDITVQSFDKSISYYISSTALFVKVMLALVALVLGVGVYRIYVDNKHLNDKVEKEVNDEVSKLIKNKEADFKKRFDDMLNNKEGDLENFSYFIKLRLFIDSDIAPKPDEIFPLLSPLCEKPIITYKHLFQKIIEKNIHSDITDKALEGLKRLDSL